MDNKNNNKEIGFLGENIAARFLTNKGYAILDRNYRISTGEIDIISEKDNTISFIEVKTNRSSVNSIFSPELRVDHRKISHISKVANIYLDKKGWLGDKEWQIDIISVIIDEVDKSAKIKHFQNVASDIY